MYLSKERLANKEEIKKKGQSLWAHIDPLFYINQSSISLEHNKTYLVESNDDVFYMEFSRREKKQYTKDPTAFN